MPIAPKISIIVPSFNQGQYLEETLISIFDQEYPNLELFVVDGGSTDNSIEIIKKHEKWITWWVSEKDQGQSDAINKGFRNATGAIISWVNSDDLLIPGSLDQVSDYLVELPAEVGLIHGAVVVFDGKKELETRATYITPSVEGYLSGMVFSQASAFFKKKYLDQVGYLNSDFHYGMDYDLFMRLALVCDFHPVQDVFAKYRLHKQSKSVADNNKFIVDWKKSFVNLCKNLGWDEELLILKNTGLFEKEIEYYHEFAFTPVERINSGINRKKATCFHLGHVLKDLYWNDRREEGRILLRLMEKEFRSEWLNEDQRLVGVIAKLKLPEFAIRSLKAIKRMLVR